MTADMASVISLVVSRGLLSIIVNFLTPSLFILIIIMKIKREGVRKFTIMERRPQETTRLIAEATSAVINKYKNA